MQTALASGSSRQHDMDLIMSDQLQKPFTGLSPKWRWSWLCDPNPAINRYVIGVMVVGLEKIRLYLVSTNPKGPRTQMRS